MTDILTEIIANKRIEVAEAKKRLPQAELEAQLQPRQYLSMRQSIEAKPYGIIAEFKRRSPSKGWIHPDAQVEDIAPLYETGGAAAMSVLTDSKFFGGSLDDLQQARSLINIPILRKDFIIDEYQLVEAAVAGADAVLLIASALTQEECADLAKKAKELGLEVLLEIHKPSELPYITPDIKMVGVNNRNLGTFHTDVENSLKIAEQLPQGITLITESGIRSVEDVRRLGKAGFRGFLIGEMLMKTADPGDTLSKLVNSL
ncbi:MAG: indole-3-glycerol phosphate synthase TrpC [Bacteroidales bacterium]|nr:indole-3-glycerol phosphate synthase TrpC [Bacteroidales bacterium]